MENGLPQRYGLLPQSHCVPDVIQPKLKVVFCGTALGYESARNQAYYAHPGNLFWRTLHQTGLTPHLIAPKDYASVTTYGIGLTDLCKYAYGLDHQLPNGAFDSEALRQKIKKFKPRILAFTSKTAASAFLEKPTGKMPYGLQPVLLNKTRLFVLPSPSGQARIYWDQRIWQQLAELAAETD